MREIEFRGKTTSEVWGYNQVEDGTWVYGFYRDEVGLPLISQFETERCDYVDYEIDRNTLGQYTGKKDKDDTKIFDGDIVKYTRKNMFAPTTSFHNQDLISLHKIYWNEEKCQFYQEHYTFPELKCIGGGPITFNDDRADENIIEVVGNIYDNPELLGEEI